MNSSSSSNNSSNTNKSNTPINTNKSNNGYKPNLNAIENQKQAIQRKNNKKKEANSSSTVKRNPLPLPGGKPGNMINSLINNSINRKKEELNDDENQINDHQNDKENLIKRKIKAEAKKKVTQLIIKLLPTILPIIATIVGIILVVLVIFLIIYGIASTENTDEIVTTECSQISMTNTSLSREEFISKLQSKSASSNNYAIFAQNAGTIYDMSVNNSINPELVVIRPAVEGFSPGGSTNNFWGIGCGSGCSSYSTFSEGVLAYLNIVSKYQNVTDMMRKYAVVSDTGYWENNGRGTSGSAHGGCYYSKYVTEILRNDLNESSRADEIESACESGKVCNSSNRDGCLSTSDVDQEAYTLWQVEKMVKARLDIFGIGGNDCSPEESIADNNQEESSIIGTQVAHYAVSTFDSYQYSQARRYNVGYVDCSSMVARAYRKFGITIYSNNLSTASGEYNWCKNNNKLISESELQPGDLIFYNKGTFYTSNRVGNVGHVSMYIGNNQQFAAHKHYPGNISKDVSVTGYTENSGTFFCRPTK